MAMFITAKLLMNTLSLVPSSAINKSLDGNAMPWISTVPEILDFRFTPNPALEGQNVNVICKVKPSDSQVLITRIRTDVLNRTNLDYSGESVLNDTVSIYNADQTGVLWGNIPYNKSGSYFCEARNLKGLVRSRSIDLLLRHISHSRIHVNLNVDLGDSKDLFPIHSAHCIVTSDGDPAEHTWVYLPLGNPSDWLNLPEKSRSITISVDTSGTYRCTGLTEAGWSTWSDPVLIIPTIGSRNMDTSSSTLCRVSHFYAFISTHLLSVFLRHISP